MVRKSRNESNARRAAQADDAQVLSRAAGILRKHVPPGREKQFEDARLLLLAMAIKIRTERAKTCTESEGEPDGT